MSGRMIKHFDHLANVMIVGGAVGAIYMAYGAFGEARAQAKDKQEQADRFTAATVEIAKLRRDLEEASEVCEARRRTGTVAVRYCLGECLCPSHMRRDLGIDEDDAVGEER